MPICGCVDRSGGAAGAAGQGGDLRRAGQSGTAASASDDATAQSNGTTWIGLQFLVNKVMGYCKLQFLVNTPRGVRYRGLL